MNPKKRWVLYAGFVLYAGIVVMLTNCQKLDDPSRSAVNYVTAPVTGSSDNTVPVSVTPQGGYAQVFDPLTNGTSVGIVSGGIFTSEGYKITADQGYIMYETSITGNIRVEFDAKGYIPNEPAHGTDDTSTIMVMHDADFYTNWVTDWSFLPNCLLQLRKLGLYLEGGQPLSTLNGIQFKGGCEGGTVGFELSSWTGDCFVGHPVAWDPSKTYHWVITVSNGVAEVFRDNVMFFSGSGFSPKNRIIVGIGGTTFGTYSPDNVTYSNVYISADPSQGGGTSPQGQDSPFQQG
jgi:hypothetical protein